MLKAKVKQVMQIYCLDENGFWNKRCIFLNMDETFMDGMNVIFRDKSIKNTSASSKEIIYV